MKKYWMLLNGDCSYDYSNCNIKICLGDNYIYNRNLGVFRIANSNNVLSLLDADTPSVLAEVELRGDAFPCITEVRFNPINKEKYIVSYKLTDYVNVKRIVPMTYKLFLELCGDFADICKYPSIFKWAFINNPDIWSYLIRNFRGQAIAVMKFMTRDADEPFITKEYIYSSFGPLQLSDDEKDRLGEIKHACGEDGWTREFIDANINNLSLRTDICLKSALTHYGYISEHIKTGFVTIPSDMELDDVYEIRVDDDDDGEYLYRID